MNNFIQADSLDAVRARASKDAYLPRTSYPIARGALRGFHSGARSANLDGVDMSLCGVRKHTQMRLRGETIQSHRADSRHGETITLGFAAIRGILELRSPFIRSQLHMRKTGILTS